MSTQSTPRPSRERYRRWNLRNREAVKAAAAKLTERNLRIVAEELARRGGHCVFPGCTDRDVEWHHRDPATKTKSIGSSIRLHSVARLTAELELCDPLCRRHHMIVDGRLEAASNYWRTHERIQTTRKADSKLSEDEVRAIRRRRREGERQPALARAYGVTQSCISNIVNRKSWRWVSD